MTFGWLVVSVFIWWLVKPLTWLESLCVAACVTATDPVLASSVVGKGKFARRIPKHLRDLLSAESGCNDGMAFPFIYLALYLIHYRPDYSQVFYHWFVYTILYDNDGWFAHKTEESHVSNVIDLLLNLAYFVYFGSIIPWDQFNKPEWGLEPWRLVCISILVIFFRRIPVMVVLRPFIPDIKTFRESLFAGHFGPMGVGAIFVAILARSELSTGNSATPLAVIPDADKEIPELLLVKVIWPIVTFMVISSIIVHGSSIAVFTLGKRINRMTLTMSYTTQGPEESWVSRLPFLNRGQSLSIRKPEDSDTEKLPPGPVAYGGGKKHSRHQSADAPRRRNGLGRPKSQATGSVSTERLPIPEAVKIHIPAGGNAYQEGDEILIENSEGDVVKQFRTLEDGGIEDTFDESKDTRAGRPGAEPPHIGEAAENILRRIDSPSRRKDSSTDDEPQIAPLERRESEAHRKRGTATAYQSGNDVIVEDEDGEVIKVIRTNTATGRSDSIMGIPSARRPSLQKIGSWLTRKNTNPPESSRQGGRNEQNDDAMSVISNEEHGIHLHNPFHGGRMSRKELMEHFQTIDPRYRTKIAQAHNLPQRIVAEAEAETDDGGSGTYSPGGTEHPQAVTGPRDKVLEKADLAAQTPDPGLSLTKLQSSASAENPENFEEETPAERRRREAALGHSVERARSRSRNPPETDAERRRREAALGSAPNDDDSDDDGTERQAPARRNIRFADLTRRGD
ncbi:hypothetical protein AA313_de0202542 [Arthrobotrys entomopaga]|nr:hypothetical protein AA313_de0202542 [Arthrobotrys entomopaga]